MDNDTYTLSCKVGKFQFAASTHLSHAKLIRDTIMGQLLVPKPGAKVIRNDADAMTVARATDDVLKTVEFTVSLKPEYGGVVA